MELQRLIFRSVCAILFALLPLSAPNKAIAATFTYDALNRIKTVTYESGGSISYTYDAAGNITGETVIADSTPPTITSRNPAVNATGVSINAAISISLSEPVTNSSAQSAISMIGPSGNVSGQVSLGTMGISFLPVVPLAAGSSYTVSVSGLRDLSGNQMPGPVNWSFSTESLPTSLVTVRFAGGGSGNVHSVPSGISCVSEPCSALFTSGSKLNLHASPSSGSIFGGWFSGPCSGLNDCELTPMDNTEVTSSFLLVQPARIAAPLPTYFDDLQAACSAMPMTAFTVEATTATFEQNLSLDQNSSIIIHGGFDAGYNGVVDYSILHGILSVVNGTLTLDRMVIK
jgi:YD repeat-containing protein